MMLFLSDCHGAVFDSHSDGIGSTQFAPMIEKDASVEDGLRLIQTVGNTRKQSEDSFQV